VTTPDPYKAVIGGSKNRANRRAAMLVVGATVIVIALVIGIITLINNKNEEKHPTNTTTTTTPTEQKLNAPKADAIQFSNSVLATQTYAQLGQFLGDPSGKPLYTYGKDTKGASKCDTSCTAQWPIYAATTTTNLPKDVTVVTRSDGKSQYAYKGMPLYYYFDDSEGMVLGDGLNGFHIAKP
jgi:predicted lipoprotein with Yx(FWY)xxD motif